MSQLTLNKYPAECKERAVTLAVESDQPGAKGPLHFAFGPDRGAAAVVAPGEVRLDLDPQRVQHLVQHVAPHHGTIIHREGRGPAGTGTAGIGLGGHGVEEQPQGYLDRCARGAVIVWVRHPAPILDDAQQEESGGTFTGVEPGRSRELFASRGADLTLPPLILYCAWNRTAGGSRRTVRPSQPQAFRDALTVGFVRSPLGACTCPAGVSTP
jgi:hypothetical protein